MTVIDGIADTFVGAGRRVRRLNFAAVRSAVLQIGAFAALDYAAYQWSHIAGWAAVGVSGLVVAWLTDPQSQARRGRHR